ncbi:MAG: AAA family ATPase [Deltaproteobacteria bacterium]|nr:AAA family ATPase [Deltaproteobacteria bacterium]
MDDQAREVLLRARAALGEVIRGKADVVELVLVAVLSGGHVLIEDVPGVGKTTLAKALARVLAVRFGRIQFTPDLLPADILGAQVLNPKDGTFSFHAGPIFANVVLADEINRASPRTQSALLEAMNEEQVTIEGTTRALPRPFVVIATQNPIDFQGTYPLPESQLDRFLVRLKMGYPPPGDELRILNDRQLGDPLAALAPVADGEQIVAWQQAVRRIEVREPVQRYLLALVTASRERRDLALGVSPRGGLALYRAAQARALLRARSYVSPEDVQELAVPTLAHRVLPTQGARYGGKDTEAIVAEIVQGVDVPT